MEIRKHLPHRNREPSPIMDWPPKAKDRFREIRSKFRGTDEALPPALQDDPVEDSLAIRPAFGATLSPEKRELILGLAERALGDIIRRSDSPE